MCYLFYETKQFCLMRYFILTFCFQYMDLIIIMDYNHLKLLNDWVINVVNHIYELENNFDNSHTNTVEVYNVLIVIIVYKQPCVKNKSMLIFILNTEWFPFVCCFLFCLKRAYVVQIWWWIQKKSMLNY